MSVQTMEGVQMFHRLGLRDCPSWERRFVPIVPRVRQLSKCITSGQMLIPECTIAWPRNERSPVEGDQRVSERMGNTDTGPQLLSSRQVFTNETVNTTALGGLILADVATWPQLPDCP